MRYVRNFVTTVLAIRTLAVLSLWVLLAQTPNIEFASAQELYRPNPSLKIVCYFDPSSNETNNILVANERTGGTLKALGSLEHLMSLYSKRAKRARVNGNLVARRSFRKKLTALKKCRSEMIRNIVPPPTGSSSSSSTSSFSSASVPTIGSSSSSNSSFIISSSAATSGSTSSSASSASSSSTSRAYRVIPAVSPANGGSITALPSQPNYIEGTVVTITANPSSGYRFVGWSTLPTGTGSSTSITMDADKVITAIFVSSTGSITASRTSCVAPCGVFFDATGTTHTNPAIRTFTDLKYEWDFGDPSSAFVNRPGVSANTATGSIAAHVFEQPSTINHIVTLTVSDNTGPISVHQVSVNVQNPDTVYSTNTYCVSFAGNFSGCPTSDASRRVTNLPASNVNGRILFRRGEAFTITDRTGLPDFAYYGAFGAGSEPVISGNFASGALIALDGVGITVTGLKFTSTDPYDPSTGLGLHPTGITMNNGSSNVTIFRNIFTNIGLNLHLGQSSHFNESVIADNFITSWQDYGMLTGDLVRVGITGNSIKQDPNAENSGGSTGVDGTVYMPPGEAGSKCGLCVPNHPDHGPIRVRGGERVLISKNDLFTRNGWFSPNDEQPTIRMGSGGLGARSSIIAENIMTGGIGVAGSGPSNNILPSDIGETIWEKNKLIASDRTGGFLGFCHAGSIVRNNLFIQPNNGSTILAAVSYGDCPNFTSAALSLRNYILGNTYISLVPTNTYHTRFVQVEANALYNITVKNNLMYIPGNQTGRFILWDYSPNPTTLDSENNLYYTNLTSPNFASVSGADLILQQWQLTHGKDGTSILQNPQFVSTSEANPDFLKLSSNSPAKDAGQNLPMLFEDFAGNPRPQGTGADIGAYEFTTP